MTNSTGNTGYQVMNKLLSGHPKQQIVGVGDYKCSKDPGSTIVTFALGSCLGITFYDRVAKIGGMLHLMLPNSKDHDRSTSRRATFADTGMEDILTALAKEGANVGQLEVKCFGGAKVTQADTFFNIGAKNIVAFDALVQQYRLRVLVKEVSGTVNRTIRLFLNNGDVSLKVPSQPEVMK